jgi:carbon monoxide dehydrogenase subunit G
LEFTGQFTTSAPVETVAKSLGDAGWISQCLPTLGKLEILSDDEFLATFKVDLGETARKMHLDYLSRLTVGIRFKYLKKTTDGIILKGTGRVAGSSLDINLNLTVKEANNETLAAWKAQVEFGRLLKLFGEKLVRDISTTTINDLTNCLRTKLASPNNKNDPPSTQPLREEDQ